MAQWNRFGLLQWRGVLHRWHPEEEEEEEEEEGGRGVVIVEAIASRLLRASSYYDYDYNDDDY